ncbi:MAG: SusD/RagB family nutrient-binding outer membrane lipoprotein [Bacteroidales bacterium]
MKTINSRFIIIILGTFFLFACTKDFEEINTNPLGFTTASTGSLFNGVIESLVPSGEEQMYVVNEIIYKQTQQGALTRSAWGNYSLGTEAMWTSYYGVLGEIRELEKRFSELPPSAELDNMKAMLKILTAYKTFKLTDVFGDIPFFDAGYGYTDLDALHPEFDSQRDIYLYLLNDLKWADENISDTAVSEEPYRTFSSFDKLFFGDIHQWQKLANSMRLRYALRMSEAEPEQAGEIILDVIENDRPVFQGYDFLTSYLESGCMWPNLVGFDFYSTSWAFREQKNLRLGSTIWKQFSVHDSLDGSGIFDPRAFIFFEPNYDGNWVAYPQLPETNTPPSGGTPYADHRDSKDSPENYYLKGVDNIYSPYNYFLVRGGQMVPIILMTGAEVHFIKSECYFRGIGVAADPTLAETEYLNGIFVIS